MCKHHHLGLRWGSRWSHEACEACAEICGGTHANIAIGAFGGVPYGATRRVMGCTDLRVHVRWWWRKSIRTPPLGFSVELRMGPRSM
eukprot:1413740-Pyramimonas_sp.AAC.1